MTALLSNYIADHSLEGLHCYTTLSSDAMIDTGYYMFYTFETNVLEALKPQCVKYKCPSVVPPTNTTLTDSNALTIRFKKKRHLQ